ncbi:MAG: tripartite tricarboxylate transporter substrate-binding protein, partial [Bacillota bacterium]|nr:tripartite tricarboxylate transporter substrate-binding protein [Bacillota bacterium]
MLKCLVTEKIREEGLSKLREAGFRVDLVYDKNLEEIKAMVGSYDVLIVRAQTPVDKDMIDAGKNLKIIAMGGIGLNHIDVEYAKSKGIDVYNVPAGSTEAVAELAVGTILTVLRRIPEANAFVKAGNWDKTKYIGREVKGKTIGILSLGKIGFRVAEVLIALGAKEVLTYDPYLKQEIADMIGAKIVSLDEV